MTEKAPKMEAVQAKMSCTLNAAQAKEHNPPNTEFLIYIFLGTLRNNQNKSKNVFCSFSIYFIKN